MKIKVLGSGCAKCNTLAQNVKEAIAALGIDAQVEKVEDIQEIMAFGVMTTPALVIDGKVVLKGSTSSVKELKEILQ